MFLLTVLSKAKVWKDKLEELDDSKKLDIKVVLAQAAGKDGMVDVKVIEKEHASLSQEFVFF